MAQKFSLDEIDGFMEWLQSELDKRNWSSYELTKRAGLSHSVMSKARLDKQPLGWEACAKIAKALDMPPEEVLRRAGYLPPVPTAEAELEELAHLFSQLSLDDRKRILSIARTFSQSKGE